MMAVFIAIATNLMDSGLRQALIRLSKVTEKDLSTAFYTNLLLGTIAYLLLFLSATHIAAFYDEPELTQLIRVLGLVVLVNAFGSVQIALFHRQMNFKAQLIAGFPAAIVSSFAAIGLAYFGAGAWALIAQIFISTALTVLLLWRLSDWRPTRAFSISSLQNLFSFSYKIFLSGALDTAFKNLYVIVIAKLFTANIAGLYFFAEKLRELVLSQIVGAIQNVTYPALAISQNDNVKLKKNYRQIIIVTTFLIFPTLLFLAALTEPLFRLLLPQKWWAAAPYLQLLCLSGLVYPLHSINLNILKVKGRSDLFLYLELVKKLITIAILLISYRYGVIGILIGQIISSVICYIPNSYYSSKLINYSASEQVKDFLPALSLSLLLGGLTYTAVRHTDWHPMVTLALFGLGGALLYLILAHALRLQAYSSTLKLLRSKIRT